MIATHQVEVRDDSRWDRSTWLGLAAIVVLFCAPLFIGLDRWDQQSDEAIYSYSVERTIETGDWLTPRAIYDDGPFYEKPPLKVWLVAGLIRLGLVPFDDRGLRTLDVLLAGIAFVYTFLFARRIAGVLAGVVAVFVLFSFDPLILEHGVRGNNMDAVLVFAYCGGVWHCVRWIEEERVAIRRRHAYAWMLLFTAAFMTKFVAAFFLPIIGVAALLARPADATASTRTAMISHWTLLRGRARELVAPAAFALLLILPWFVYETVRAPWRFWYEMVGVHVYLRFFDVLAPTHLQPWHHYFTQLWFELGLAGLRPPVLLGLAALIWQGWWRRDWLARVAIVWWLLPLALLSAGTSKLFYYSYPFLPPLGIGAGLVTARLFDVLRGPRMIAWLTRIRASLVRRRLAPSPGRWRTALLVIGVICFGLGVATAIHGPITIETDGIRLFRSSSVTRVVVLGAVAWYLAGMTRAVPALTGLVIAALVLPVDGYAPRVRRLSFDNHPLRATRDCGLEVQRTHPAAARGVLAAGAVLHHSYFFYLRHLGPYVYADATALEEVERRLHDPDSQTPVIVSVDTYKALGGTAPAGGPSDTPPTPARSSERRPMPPGYAIGEVIVLLPGPYGRCVEPAAHGIATALPAIPGETPAASGGEGVPSDVAGR
jgi:4-amino-4-deoxy-L-arabinose transferase-like glycosyltransferase